MKNSSAVKYPGLFWYSEISLLTNSYGYSYPVYPFCALPSSPGTSMQFTFGSDGGVIHEESRYTFNFNVYNVPSGNKENTDQITGGYDNSGMSSDKDRLDSSLQEYEESEQTVLDQVNDSLNDFEFNSGFDEYKNTIKVFSDFIQDLYEASGAFQTVINLSVMLSIAGIVIGVYRFRDGG